MKTPGLSFSPLCEVFSLCQGFASPRKYSKKTGPVYKSHYCQKIWMSMPTFKDCLHRRSWRLKCAHSTFTHSTLCQPSHPLRKEKHLGFLTLMQCAYHTILNPECIISDLSMMPRVKSKPYLLPWLSRAASCNSCWPPDWNNRICEKVKETELNSTSVAIPGPYF